MANQTTHTQGNTAERETSQASGQTFHQNQQGRGLQGTQPQGGQRDAQQQSAVDQPQQGTMANRRPAGIGRYGNDPFVMVQQLADEMDQLFDSFFYGVPTRRQAQQQQYRAPALWAPEVEVSQEGNQLRVALDLPGISKENVKIELQEGALVIQGERREERTQGSEQGGYRRSERRYGSFYRAVPLPEGADAEQAKAQMKDGVLEITIPLAEPKRARQLEIKG
jgi:HSP20 family protein